MFLINISKQKKRLVKNNCYPKVDLNNLKMKTMNFSFDNKDTTNSNNKKSFNIQTNNQLKAYLLNENVCSLKNILLFINTAMKHFHQNLSLFYEILTQLIDKINDTVNNQCIKYEQSDKSLIVSFVSEFSSQLEIINQNFDSIFSQELITYYLYSFSKHNITVFIFCIMTTFTYISFEVEANKTSRKEIYHLLQKIRNKYICCDMNRVLCPGCSLNCITKMLIYINRFITEKSPEQNCNEIKEELQKMNKLSGKITVIKSGIEMLEKLLEEEKRNSKRVMEEMNKLLIHSKI